MQPDWDKLKKEYADTPNVVIGQLDCAGNGQSTCGQHGVQGYPTIKTVKDGRMEDYNGGRNFAQLKQHVESKLNPRPACSLESKDACTAKDRAVLEESEKMSKAERSAKIKEVEAQAKEKQETAKRLEKEAKDLIAQLDLIKAGGQKVEKVEQLLDDAEMRAHCESRTCVVAFLPHILDDFAKGRNERLKVLDEALKASKKDGKSVGFLWSQGGDQFDMEEAFGLQFGFPAVIAINFGKGRFGVHRGTLDKDSVTQFLTSLARGGVPLAPIPASAKAVKVDPWDGKDGELPSEDL
mmetsp:Transcript_104181/g.293801  ORF Transcript_104181/g.293801 Transcript_104181/m.293801 type:complete len:295 (+) Transcript_104181:242-1126(+)